MTHDISADDVSAHHPATNGVIRQSPDEAREDRVLRARVHLLPADGLLTEPCLHPPREYVTVCGQVITDVDLPHATCPDDACDCELRYCPTCIQDATTWNAELEGEMQEPGWTAQASSHREIDADDTLSATSLHRA